mgnify:CR=1 FL=1
MISYKEYKKLRNTKWDDLSEENKGKRLKEFERRLNVAHKFLKKLINKEHISEKIEDEIPSDDIELRDFMQTVRILADEKKGET